MESSGLRGNQAVDVLKYSTRSEANMKGYRDDLGMSYYFANILQSSASTYPVERRVDGR